VDVNVDVVVVVVLLSEGFARKGEACFSLYAFRRWLFKSLAPFL
jgi:hypothetical protein